MAITDIKQYTHLTQEDIEQLGRELDAIRTDIEESRGERDARYVRRTIQLQRGLAAGGRIALFASKNKIAWSPVPPCSRWRRSSRTWNSGTTSLMASGIG